MRLGRLCWRTQQSNTMSLLSFVKFPYRMPVGFVQTDDYDTKDIRPSEFVTQTGRRNN
ncbi:hypothetical protein BDI4_830001 [Burkholderia diffusa]|nr:hypothetical protein BDI4_830001 [Burkholderia diffusa]